MTRARRSRAVVRALYVNAALLGAILVYLASRGGGVGTPAFAAPQMAPIAGGGGVYLMPAQFSINTWGCYVLDTDRQTMAAYQYTPGEKLLQFKAARGFRQDLELRNWNTSPSPDEMARLVQLERDPVRGQAQNPNARDRDNDPSREPGANTDPRP